MNPMDQARLGSRTVLIASTDGEYATVLCHGCEPQIVLVADLEPLEPPHYSRSNRSDEAAAEKRSYRAEQRRKRAEKQDERAAFEGSS